MLIRGISHFSYFELEFEFLKYLKLLQNNGSTLSNDVMKHLKGIKTQGYHIIKDQSEKVKSEYRKAFLCEWLEKKLSSLQIETCYQYVLPADENEIDEKKSYSKIRKVCSRKEKDFYHLF